MAGYYKLSLVLAFVAGCNLQIPNAGPPQTGCGDDDPRVGQTAVLEGYFHGVSGTARIVDNCTIVIENFSYDGGGGEVHVIVSPDSDYRNNAKSLTGQIAQKGSYNNVTMTLPLPVGVTLDDVHNISIMCLSFGINLGEGTFQ